MFGSKRDHGNVYLRLKNVSRIGPRNALENVPRIDLGNDLENDLRDARAFSEPSVNGLYLLITEWRPQLCLLGRVKGWYAPVSV